MNRDWIFHDSQALFFRNPFGAVTCDKKITLRLEINSQAHQDAVILRLWKNGNNEEKINMYVTQLIGGKRIYQAEITAPSNPGLLWYYFIVKQNGHIYYYGNNHENLGGIGQLYEYEPPSYQITVYKKEATTPNWFKESVMYQIFVDRFYNGYEKGQMLGMKKKCYIYDRWEDTPYYRKDPDTGKIVCFDFYGGNLLGVMKKLSYLKELGINVIYFNPIFEAPSNHKYDTANYKKIDPMFGDNQFFKEFCKKAKEMGIYIILDGVFSHTGSDSVYFNKEGRYADLGAYQSKESPYYSWYIFHDYPEKYECWWGIDTLPNVNEMEPSYQNFIIHDEDSVLRYWMKMGAKGWRLDVVDELPDEFVKKFRQVMKETDPESVLIGEVWEDASRKISYGKMREYLLGDELDSVMNYPFRNILFKYLLGRQDAYNTNRALMSLYENYPLQHFYTTMNLVGTHDVPRTLTILGEAPSEHTLSKEEQRCYLLTAEQKKLAVARLKLISLFQITFPGVPCIYYGDEVGMEGYGDPLCRGTYPWGKENKEILAWYKKIISLRNNYDVFKTGRWIPIYAQGDIYAYLRLIENGKDVFNQSKENNAAVVLFNSSIEKEFTLTLDLSKWCTGKMIDLLHDDQEIPLKNGMLNVLIKPLEGKLFIQ